MTDLEGAHVEFWEELLRDVHVSGESQLQCFFEAYAPLAAENGDCVDLTHAHVRREGSRGFQVDGYAIDLEVGELHLAVSDFRADGALDTLNQQQIDSLFKRAERFVQEALKAEFINALEEASSTFQAAQPIYQHRGEIKRVRLILFSNAQLVSKKKGVESKAVNGLTFTYNLLDFTRYLSIQASRGRAEPIEIDFRELDEHPLRCLQAHTGEGHYASFLVAISGELLAKIYGLYGPRLLEQNVRTFLQARTKVNKGIIRTLEEAPEMFFAYNNGITATASAVETELLADGTTGIAVIKDLQIVNGGQTTASILYAKDQAKSDLGEVYVQMKLTEVDPEELEDIVPKISRFANTQNRISEADFFSSAPFHLEMERLSRRLTAPQQPGAFSASKWFYERARGQYKDSQAYGSKRERDLFKTEFPPNQVIVKTDLAKTEMTFACKPDVVSKGAQKCFLQFAEDIGKQWNGAARAAFHEAYFKDAVAKTILFRWTDSMVGRSDWYKADRGYKAQTVTYTLSWLVNHLDQSRKSRIDLQKIWQSQCLSEELEEALTKCAPVVAGEIKSAPPELKNIGEYCKRQLCWAAVKKLPIALRGDLAQSTIDRDEQKQRTKETAAEGKFGKEVEFDVLLIQLFPLASEIKVFAEERNQLSPKSASALAKMAAGKFEYTRGEKNALKYLFKNLREAGFKFPDAGA